jgi:bifunctional non-homologous end joining protein LigD
MSRRKKPPVRARGSRGETAKSEKRRLGRDDLESRQGALPDAHDRRPVTKLDLAHYFEAAGPWMLEHLRARPCSVVRAPDGIGGQRFLPAPRDAGTSSLIGLVKIPGDA